MITRLQMPAAIGALIASLCAGCGVVVPQIKEPWESLSANRQITFGIKQRVYCDIKAAVKSINKKAAYYIENRKTGRKIRQLPLPAEWGVRVSLALTIDEKSSLSPSATLMKPLENAVYSVSNAPVPIVAAQSFNLGLGGELTSTATRIEKFDPFYTVSYLMEPYDPDSTCLVGLQDAFPGESPLSQSSPLIISDLGIDRWLEDAIFTARLLPSNDSTKAGSGTLPDTFSLEIKFAIVSNANVNPSWKLVRISTGTGGNPLFSTGRTRTHDLIITIGPQDKNTTDTHLASLIGQAVSTSNRALLAQ